MALAVIGITAFGVSGQGSGTSSDPWIIGATEDDNVTAYLNGTDELVIEGTGAMKDFATSADLPWVGNRSAITKLRMSENAGITNIGNYAFYGCVSLTSVTISNSVTSIGAYAFYSCYQLTDIVIPNSVTSIGSSAFYGCSRLASVNIPNGVTSIENHAFGSCTQLTDIIIHNRVKSIGDYAFYSTGLTKIIIPNSVTSIGNSAFSNNDLLTENRISR